MLKLSNFRDNLKIQASINPKYFRNTSESIKNDDLEANALSFEKVGINTENYYLVKAKVTKLPTGLEYLAIAKQYHIIWMENMVNYKSIRL